MHQKSYRVISIASLESLRSGRSPDQLSEDLIGGACGGIVVVFHQSQALGEGFSSALQVKRSATLLRPIGLPLTVSRHRLGISFYYFISHPRSP